MNTLERVESALAGLKSSRVESRDGTPVLEIAPSDVHEACKRLRDAAGFETNTFITAVDRFPAEPRFEVCWQFLSVAHNDRVRLVARVADGDHTHSPAADRVQMARHLGDHVIVETRAGGASIASSEAATPALGGTVDARHHADSGASLPPSSSSGSSLPSVASIVDLFPGTAYSERECYDMFGIRFDGHPDLKRLLMPDDYGHFPLRKDFPHQGIEPDRLYREWDAARHRTRVKPAPARESVP